MRFICTLLLQCIVNRAKLLKQSSYVKQSDKFHKAKTNGKTALIMF